MLSCHDATRMLSEAQERRLGVLERVSLRLHLAICAACRRFDRQLPLLRHAMRAFRDRRE
ncbi:MAG: zf-HC2 domain-containing protein [Steroidobacteraceae bacterium]